jgi:hypothetical protein
MDSFCLKHVYYVGICDIGKITAESAAREGCKWRGPQIYKIIHFCFFFPERISFAWEKAVFCTSDRRSENSFSNNYRGLRLSTREGGGRHLRLVIFALAAQIYFFYNSVYSLMMATLSYSKNIAVICKLYAVLFDWLYSFYKYSKTCLNRTLYIPETWKNGK